MVSEKTQNLIFETLFWKKDFREFEKYIYSLSLKEGKKIFSEKIFLELLEFDYDKWICFEFEKIFFEVIDFNEFFKKYLVFLIENFLKKDENFFEIFDLLYDYYCWGFGFLEPFINYMRFKTIFFENDKNHEIILEICEKIPKIKKDLESWKYKNLYFEDEIYIENSILSSRGHRFIYDEN